MQQTDRLNDSETNDIIENDFQQEDSTKIQTEYFMKLSSEFDNYLFLSITGTLLLSMNFITISNFSHNIKFIYFSWGALCLGLTSMLLSYVHTLSITYKESQGIETEPNKYLDNLSNIAGLCLITGIISLSAFVVTNISNPTHNQRILLSPSTELYFENGDFIKYENLVKLNGSKQLDVEVCYKEKDYIIVLIDDIYYKVLTTYSIY